MLEQLDPQSSPEARIEGPGPFAVVEASQTVDYLLLGLEQQMVQLTGQADLKGSIIITASAIVLSISATQFGDAELRWSLVTLLFFVLLALLSSILAVFSKFRIHPEVGDNLPPGFNPFFFGHFSQIPKARHAEYMAEVLRDPRTTYRVMVEDIYDQGVYLLTKKYRFLRFSYATFLIGFLAASVQLTITVIFT
jgi:Pycsar effector protein